MSFRLHFQLSITLCDKGEYTQISAGKDYVNGNKSSDWRYHLCGEHSKTIMSYLGRSFEKLHTELCPYSYLGRLPACPCVAVTTDIYSPRLYLFSVSLDCAYARNAFSPRYLNKSKILGTLHSCILSTILQKVPKVPKVRMQMYTKVYECINCFKVSAIF